MLVYHVTKKENAANILAHGFSAEKMDKASIYGTGIYFYLIKDNSRTKLGFSCTVLECEVNPNDILFLDNHLAREYRGIPNYENKEIITKTIGWRTAEEVIDAQYEEQSTEPIVRHLVRGGYLTNINFAFSTFRDKGIVVMKDPSKIKVLKATDIESKPIQLDLIKNESKINNKVIRLTESQFRKLISESVKKVLREHNFSPEKSKQIQDAWTEYDNMYQRDDSDDELNIELDRSLNKDDTRDMAHSYAMNDPMHQRVKGSTLRYLLKASMGNDMKP